VGIESVAVFQMRSYGDAFSVEKLVTRCRFPHAAPYAQRTTRQAEAKMQRLEIVIGC
jgi:ABC-type cobalamin/Fe3+-siderophores transport system ATPase subunit